MERKEIRSKEKNSERWKVIRRKGKQSVGKEISQKERKVIRWKEIRRK